MTVGLFDEDRRKCEEEPYTNNNGIAREGWKRNGGGSKGTEPSVHLSGCNIRILGRLPFNIFFRGASASFSFCTKPVILDEIFSQIYFFIYSDFDIVGV